MIMPRWPNNGPGKKIVIRLKTTFWVLQILYGHLQYSQHTDQQDHAPCVSDKRVARQAAYASADALKPKS